MTRFIATQYNTADTQGTIPTQAFGIANSPNHQVRVKCKISAKQCMYRVKSYMPEEGFPSRAGVG